MTQDEIIEAAIQGHASTCDAIRWAMSQEREACAKVCDNKQYVHPYHDLGTLIRARGEA
jgi:hypothetical protein